jgi:hypothetical protein
MNGLRESACIGIMILTGYHTRTLGSTYMIVLAKDVDKGEDLVRK